MIGISVAEPVQEICNICSNAIFAIIIFRNMYSATALSIAEWHCCDRQRAQGVSFPMARPLNDEVMVLQGALNKNFSN